MDLLRTYASDDDSSSSKGDSDCSPLPKLKTVAVAPDVAVDALPEQVAACPTNYNPVPRSLHNQNAKNVYIDPVAFDEQYNSFSTKGVVADPSNGMYRRARLPRSRKRSRADSAAQPVQKNDESTDGVSIVQTMRSDDSSAVNSTLKNVTSANSRLSNDDLRSAGVASSVLVPKTEWHVPTHEDITLRTKSSWLKPPGRARTFEELEEYTPYIPKRVIHTYSAAHDRGVGVLRFFPGYGHLLLSAGLDGVVKMWDVHSHRKCMRSYTGHSKGIRDVCFTNDGRMFLTAGFDRSILLWDTETGRVLGSFSGNRAIPYCVRFHMDDDKQNEFLAGCSDKKVIQLDVRNGDKIIQSYDQHMGAVNSIAFVDDYRRFVSSADDKVLRVWEYGIPVVIKYVSDPSMHSMPVLSVHPNGKYMCCQSMDNTIPVYSVQERFKLNRKKLFSGHLVAGYACGLSFSPDGRFVVSGDSMGRIFFWDWKSTRMFRVMKAHDGVAIDVAWHPTESSRVASCGWDGDIKLWD